MTDYQILVLYKDGHYKQIDERNLKEKHVDKKKVKYLLCQDPNRETVYNIIKPSPMWLNAKFRGSIMLQAVQTDMEEMLVLNLANIPSSIETTSLCEFVHYLTTLYRINGFGEILESENTDYPHISYTFMPIEYHFRFLNTQGKVVDRIDSRELEKVNREVYVEDGVYQFVIDERMRDINDLLFELDTGVSKSLHGVPRTILLNDGVWYKNNKMASLPDNIPILVNLAGFGSYTILNRSVINRIISAMPLHLDVYTFSEQCRKILEIQFGVDMSQKLPPILQRALVEHVLNSNGLDISAFTFNLNFDIADIYQYLSWMTYSQEMISYLNIFTACVNADIEIDFDNAISFGHLVEFGMLFSNQELISGELNRALGKHLFERGVKYAI